MLLPAHRGYSQLTGSRTSQRPHGQSRSRTSSTTWSLSFQANFRSMARLSSNNSIYHLHQPLAVEQCKSILSLAESARHFRCKDQHYSNRSISNPTGSHRISCHYKRCDTASCPNHEHLHCPWSLLCAMSRHMEHPDRIKMDRVFPTARISSIRPA